MGYSKQWEAFLFKRLNIVAALPMQKIELLDLLVKRTGGIWGSNPRLINLGSCLLYRLNPDPSDSEFKELDNEFVAYEWDIKLGLEALQSSGNQFPEGLAGDIFTYYVDYNVEISEQVATDSGLGAKIMHWLTGSCGTSNQVEYTIVEPSHVAIKEDALHSLFIGHGRPPLWTPDISKIKMSHIRAAGTAHEENGENGGFELWLVTEKLFCESLETDGANSTSVDVSITADANCNAGIQAGSSSQERSHIRGPYLFGYKAIRLFHGSDGKLLRWSRDMGDKRPTVRLAENTEGGLESDPVYHMGGLFAKPPPELVDDSEWGNVHLECLTIESLEEMQPHLVCNVCKTC